MDFRRMAKAELDDVDRARMDEAVARFNSHMEVRRKAARDNLTPVEIAMLSVGVLIVKKLMYGEQLSKAKELLKRCPDEMKAGIREAIQLCNKCEEEADAELAVITAIAFGMTKADIIEHGAGKMLPEESKVHLLGHEECDCDLCKLTNRAYDAVRDDVHGATEVPFNQGWGQGCQTPFTEFMYHRLKEPDDDGARDDEE